MNFLSIVREFLILSFKVLHPQKPHFWANWDDCFILFIGNKKSPSWCRCIWYSSFQLEVMQHYSAVYWMRWDMGQGLAQFDVRNKIVGQSQRGQNKVKAWKRDCLFPRTSEHFASDYLKRTRSGSSVLISWQKPKSWQEMITLFCECPRTRIYSFSVLIIVTTAHLFWCYPESFHQPLKILVFKMCDMTIKGYRIIHLDPDSFSVTYSLCVDFSS